jgi:hypothetical protein
MLTFHCVDHLLLKSQVREMLVNTLRHLRISAQTFFKSRFPRLAPGSPPFNRFHTR